MFRLHYAGDSVLISSTVGSALMRYARALADAQAADVVSVPIVDEEGHMVKAEFLLGPSSQLYTTPVADVAEMGSDPAVVDELNLRGRRLRPSAQFAPEATGHPHAYDHDAL